MNTCDITLLNKLSFFTGFLLMPLIVAVFWVTAEFFSKATGRRGSYKIAWETYKIPVVLIYSVTFINLLVFLFIPLF